MILFHFWSFAMASHLHCSDFDSALSLAEKCWSSNEPEVALPFMVQHFGINALVAIDQWRKTRKSRYWKKFRRFCNQLKAWAKKGNLNGLHFISLLDAEAVVVKEGSKSNYVRKLYDSSITSACHSGFIHDAALASTRCGKYFLDRNDTYWAPHFLSRAREPYIEWGAVAAVRNLESPIWRLACRGELQAPVHQELFDKLHPWCRYFG
jgi:hypothetical protein